MVTVIWRPGSSPPAAWRWGSSIVTAWHHCRVNHPGQDPDPGLANAGVPLARVKDLLDADPDTLAAAIAEIDHDIQDRIARLRRARAELAQLRGGDRLFVTPDVADYLDELRELGISERQVRLERDGWILMHTAAPRT